MEYYRPPDINPQLITTDEAFNALKKVLLDVNVRDDRAIQEQIRIALAYIAGLRMHRNSLLVTINRLPIEALILILLLSFSPIKENSHPYIALAGVCRHWRSVILGNSCFWTLIQDVAPPFVQSIIQRSKLALLDMIIRDNSAPFLLAIQDFFVGQDRHLRTLQLLWHERLPGNLKTFLSYLNLSRLEGLVLGGFSRPCTPLTFLLSGLGHLSTMQCTLETDIPLVTLTHIVANLRTFSLRILSPVTPSLLVSLLSHGKELQNLLLDAPVSGPVTFPAQLPRLRFLSISRSSLLRYVQTTALSSIFTTWKSNVTVASLDYRTLGEFNFSTIGHLYMILNDNQASPVRYSILGSKDPLHPNTSFSINTDCFVNDVIRTRDLDISGPSDSDVVFGEFPRDTFCLNFEREDVFSGPLKQGLTLDRLLPRLTSLAFLYLSFPRLPEPHLSVEKIISQVPSITKLVVIHPDTTVNFIHALNNTNMVPRLRYLSYTTSAQTMEKKKPIAKALTKCIQLRRRIPTHQLVLIVLGKQCPSLSPSCITKLQRLGTKVVTP